MIFGRCFNIKSKNFNRKSTYLPKIDLTRPNLPKRLAKNIKIRTYVISGLFQAQF